MKQRSIIFFFFFISMNLSQGQEVLTGLGENPLVAKAAKEDPFPANTKAAAQLELPFLDDFSYNRVFPDDSLWEDRDVFINNSYAYQPFNIGVATFDALNDTGALHDNAIQGLFAADTLTSRDIRMDSITRNNKKLRPSDSIYLSFYIQPQGIGNAPEESDSIVLKLYAPKQQNWHYAWSMKGTDLQTFYDSNLVYMKRIMIPITDTIFFHPGFKLRFINYASLSNNSIPSWVGNVDIWNLDYVYLDIQRVQNDTSLVDWTLTSESHSLLKNYEHMPWAQYKVAPVAEMEDTFRISYRSNKGHRKDVNMTLKVLDNKTQSTSYNTFPSPITNQKMPSFSTFLFEHFLDYNYPPNSDQYYDYEVLFHIDVPDDPYHFNDSSRFYQRFYNYYAYDDGTAEAGYGLSSIGAQLAYQFTLNQPDTLRSVQMYFNRVKNNANIKPFTLTLWDDNNGEPGSIIYQQNNVIPKISDKINQYKTYVLDKPQLVSGTFYIGWQQTTNDNLNLGFDLNRKAEDHIFYNTFGTWNNTIYEGALMIRPILGNDNDAHVSIPKRKQENSFSVFPNPAHPMQEIHIKTDIEARAIAIDLLTLTGRKVKTYQNTKSLTVPSLSNGIYLLQITDLSTGNMVTKKLLIHE
ncbi:MAG: T9SS type A sorting domain-containing protein [Bacteroidales bacterium]